MKKVGFFLHFLVFLNIIQYLYIVRKIMIKFYYGFIGLLWTMLLLVSPCFVWATDGTNVFNWGATKLLDDIYSDQKQNNEAVQDTKMDYVSSDACNELSLDGRFTISKTLCYIKQSLHHYLQYVIYVGLSAAVIFLIWNGFKIITSSDREKEMGNFKKNLKYLIIWVILLVSFYAIIEIFVSVVNLLSPWE